ncbi:YggT family protein [Chromobacterium haemolyticum]|nr:YggT family protein [Chromobacterium haemolyticum]
MFFDTLRFLIHTLSGLFVLVLLLRFYLQVARAPFKHPLCQFVMAATNFAVLPMRKLVPAMRGYDSATMLLAWLISLLANVLVTLLSSGRKSSPFRRYGWPCLCCRCWKCSNSH